MSDYGSMFHIKCLTKVQCFIKNVRLWFNVLYKTSDYVIQGYRYVFIVHYSTVYCLLPERFFFVMTYYHYNNIDTREIFLSIRKVYIFP